MRRIIAIILVLGAAATGANTRAAGGKIVAEANNAFAFDLYQRLNRSEGNLFFSPLSISSALAMTYAGARGETARQMARVLHFPGNTDLLHRGFQDLLIAMKKNRSDRDIELTIANSLWAQKDYTFLPDFLTLVTEHHDAAVENVDFKTDAEGARQRINAWVEKETNEKIKDLVPMNALNQATRLVLANAIYFMAAWQSKFHTANTREDDFWVDARASVKVPMMIQTDNLPYFEDDRIQVLTLPYLRSGRPATLRFSLIVVLPKKRDGLGDVEKALRLSEIDGWLKNRRHREVKVFLPRFRIESSFNLAEHLTAMGMEQAFAFPGADFSGMDGTHLLYISAVLHKAFVDVDEEGTEAAAATAVVMLAGAAAPSEQPKVFRADHPFLFLIREEQSGTIFFMGRLCRPDR